MLDSLRELLKSPGLKQRLIFIAALIFAFHAAVIFLLLSHASSYPTLLGLALLAYGLGLRHSVDPDHIAAIDNTTRKLMQEGKKPVGVGFFFALGHSSIVIVMCMLVAVSASFVNDMLPVYKETGVLVSSLASCFFLLAIGFINLFVLVDTFKTWRKLVRGDHPHDLTLEEYLSTGGLLARILKPVLNMVGTSWSMYWVGLLFGLGFDTASEVALLGMSGSTGVSSMPLSVILVIPLAFTVGMTLIDTLDGILMLGAYGWAFLKPARKLYYNVTITFTSVMIALFIGGIEGLQIISKHTGATGWLWDFANGLELENWGFYIIGIFIVSWSASMLLYRLRGYDSLTERKP
ncbi:MAG: HoxN/HupN/NixA family nickel/cobalt transporter [Candidatus Obscuribacter sp.]|nr:HoxN/HupN/NixA family nickel/cobalt transporter [Candidatus Obscuribacter sp.]